ncbi:MAG: BTAD domain-containing putative transcriptional regulator [Geminicoccaceae bacterium]
MLALLWPESDEERARGSLRQVLFQTRRCLECAGYSGLSAIRDEIVLEGEVITDIEQMFAEIEKGQVPGLLSGVRPPGEQVLSNFSLPGDVFGNWLNVRRAEIEDRLRMALKPAIESSSGETRRAFARLCAALDPTDETAVRALMRAHVELGDVGSALATYEKLWNLLDEEYETEPSQATRDLAVRIKLDQALLGEEPPGASDAPSQPAGEHAVGAGAGQPPFIQIEVRNFDASDVASETGAFISLFRSELISCLNRFREWRVSDSVAGGEDADNNYVLCATARTVGDTIRLHVVLNDGDGNPVWTEATENLLQNWVGFLGSIAGSLAASLNLNLSHARLSRLALMRTGSANTPKAIDRWLMSQQYVLAFTPDGWNRAIELNSGILVEDPDFVRAHTSLAQLYNIRNIVFPGRRFEQGDFIQAADHADRAIARDPLDAQAHLCRGWALTMQRRYRDAGLSLSLAVEANPNDAWVIVSSALAVAFAGDCERARSLAQRALDLGWTVLPRDWCYISTIHFLCGDYPDCIRAAVAGQDAIGNVAAWQAAAHIELGQEDHAARACQRFHDYATRAWQGEEPPTDENIDRWFLEAFPIAEAATTDRLRSGLERSRALWKRAI